MKYFFFSSRFYSKALIHCAYSRFTASSESVEASIAGGVIALNFYKSFDFLTSEGCQTNDTNIKDITSLFLTHSTKSDLSVYLRPDICILFAGAKEKVAVKIENK